MEFGYSLLEIKAIDDDERVITGVASNVHADRDGDIMEPKGAEFSLPMPFLWQHNRERPIGEVFFAKASATQIEVKARVAKVNEPGELKNFLDFAWQSLKARLVKGLSVGFRGLDVEPIQNSFGLRFKKWAWLELSAVTIPSNASATIALVKSADSEYLAASGIRPRVPSTSGVPDVSRAKTMNIAEQIAARRAELRTKNERLAELMTKDQLSTEENDDRATLTQEVKAIASTIESFEALEAGQAAMAKAVAGDSPVSASASRQVGPQNTPHVQVNEVKLPPGIAFARLVLCKMAAFLSARDGEPKSAHAFALERYPSHQHLALALKAAVAPAMTTVTPWAGALVYAETIAGDFLEFLRPQTIIGKFGTGNIPSLRRVPFVSRLVGQDSGGTAYWVGQAKPKPLTKLDFSAQTLDFAKIVALTVLAEELARFSNPSAESLCRDSLARTIVQALDTDFIDPATAAVANVSPASITNGVTPLTPSGTNADAVRADIGTIISEYLDANVDPTGLVLIMPNTVALAVSLMRTSLGTREFPDMSMFGGTLEGLPVIASQVAANASGSGNLVIAVNARDVALADDETVSIDVSREAALEMKDSSLTQDGSVGTGVSLVSLWQNNLLGIKAERFITWKKLRSTAVVYMDDVAWGGAGSPS